MLLLARCLSLSLADLRAENAYPGSSFFSVFFWFFSYFHGLGFRVSGLGFLGFLGFLRVFKGF